MNTTDAHKHRCLRCGQEFDCQTPGICRAQYNVLPTIVRADGSMVEHCSAPVIHLLIRRGSQVRGTMVLPSMLVRELTAEAMSLFGVTGRGRVTKPREQGGHTYHPDCPLSNFNFRNGEEVRLVVHRARKVRV